MALAYLQPRPDGQAQILYQAEGEIGRGCTRRFDSLEHIVRWLNRTVMPTDWWWQHGIDDLQITGQCTPELGPDYASAEKDGTEATLFLPRRWSWTDNFVLHELCHLTTWGNARQWHGPTFARDRLDAQYMFGLPNSGDNLELAYNKYSVKY